MSELDDRIVAVLMALHEGEVVGLRRRRPRRRIPRSSQGGRQPARWDRLPTLDLPWWRVVRSDGRIATDPASGQAALLRAEGVTVRAGRVVDAPIGRFRRR